LTLLSNRMDPEVILALEIAIRSLT